MFSKSLFKQSCKANGLMWGIITFAVCFMLACVMCIAGGSNIADTSSVLSNTIIKDELTAQIESRSLNYYNVGCESLLAFDNYMVENYNEIKDSPEANKVYDEAYNKAKEENLLTAIAIAKAIEAKTEYVSVNSYKQTMIDFAVYVDELIEQKGYEPTSNEAKELKGSIIAILNPMIDVDKYACDDMYLAHNEPAPRYDIKGALQKDEDERKLYRQNYASTNSIVVLSANAIKEENVVLILDALSRYGVTYEKFKEFGFTNYDNVKDVASLAQINFRANLAYRLENMKKEENEQTIIEELTLECSKSLLASLPSEVSKALDEIGQSDLYGVLVGSIFFKMAGLLLPIIYMIMTSNNLIAGQVDSGSMAYILSTGTKRHTVVFTQALYLIGSLFAMFSCTTITSLICLAFVNVHTDLTYGKLLLINLGAFITMFAMSGICFLASCWFNRSKRSMAIGGGLNMFFLVATMLGLFGSPVLPSIVRMEALNIFNYMSIISLFDVTSILELSTTFIYKLIILVVLGLVCYIVGSVRFKKKDLPL